MTAVCNCLNKMYCVCRDLITPPGISQISEKDLEEWKRIEHVDQFNIRRRP